MSYGPIGILAERYAHRRLLAKERCMQYWRWIVGLLGILVVVALPGRGAMAWEPQKPVELIIPAGPGGGADVMARFITPLISKYNLAPQPFVAVNKPGGAGAEGFL